MNQDYVYNWTRDAATVAIELAAGTIPTNQPLIDYVQFAQACQNAASAFGHFDRASFFIDGTPRQQCRAPALGSAAALPLAASGIARGAGVGGGRLHGDPHHPRGQQPVRGGSTPRAFPSPDIRPD